MKGIVDDQLRALITLPVSRTRNGPRKEILAWVDTAFNGGLVLPKHLITDLGLAQESSAEAILADGSLVQLETFACFFEWFGDSYETQIVANDGKFPLLGTILLNQHRLIVDYDDHTVELL